MISTEHKTHQKHAKLKRPDIGEFGRNEVAILGTPCGNIKKLSSFLIEQLGHLGHLAFIDADHKASEPDQQQVLNFTDKISFRRFDYLTQFNSFQMRPFFNNSELVIVNGNHFKAAAQIVVIDPKKSLEHKLDRITNPLLVVKKEPDVTVPDYLSSHLAGLPVMEWDQMTQIANFVEAWTTERKPELKGLVLAGGRSVRMEQDKGALRYHGMSQRAFVYQQFEQIGLEGFISCRKQQQDEVEKNLPLLLDTFEGLGPMGALLSAFREDPNSAWLAIACDLPYLTTETIQYLLANRDSAKVATAFQSPFDEFPEPLITIWEPRSYRVLLDFLSQGYSCPRKVLINSDVKLIQVPNAKDLSNINHPEEYQKAISDLRS